jgi:hypothetical protein
VQLAESKQVVDLTINVLDARVGNHGGAVAVLEKILSCLDKNQTCALRFQSRGQFPCQDSAAEIVYHRMQIRARTVEQFDDRHINVPVFIRFARANTLFGLGRIDAVTWPNPSTLADEAPPRRWRNKHLGIYSLFRTPSDRTEGIY